MLPPTSTQAKGRQSLYTRPVNQALQARVKRNQPSNAVHTMAASVVAVRNAQYISLEEVASKFCVPYTPLGCIEYRTGCKSGGYGVVEHGMWETRQVVLKNLYSGDAATSKNAFSEVAASPE
eukprot:1179636-Prorocentrum_minimum.AAC.1